MLEKKFYNKGLLHFDFYGTQWYRKIHSETAKFKYNLILCTLLTTLAAPLALIAANLVQGYYSMIPFHAALFFLIIILLLYHVRFHNLRVMVVLALILPVIFYFISVNMPGTSGLHLLLFCIYPLLAIQMQGSWQGSIFSGVFLSLILMHFLLETASIIPDCAVYENIEARIISFAAYALVWFMSWAVERRYESMVERFSDMLVFDESTGLPSRDVLMHSIIPGQCYIFAIIKIDNFSDLVALFGYEFSDIILQFASQKLKKYEERYGYKTYHLKYNEYGILLPTDTLPTINDTAQTLLSIMKSLDIEALPWEQDKIRLVYRIGGTSIHPEDSRSPLSRADIALKKAERSHSVLMVFDGDVSEKNTAYANAIRFTDLITNRDDNSFRVVFQPIFCGKESHVVWYEALLRIKRQDGEYVSIYPYLDVARSTGLYPYITDFVLREAARAICKLDVDVSINISINDIVRPEFIQLIDEIYDQIREKKGRIIFEILESDELVELEKCIWFIDYVSHYKFRIAIDDFGTGYSNYSSLINIPVDIVKIDGSLIKRINSDENAKTLVEGIIHFCVKANKKTVAEFVEDEKICNTLKAMGIDYLQGFYLGEPAAFIPEK